MVGGDTPSEAWEWTPNHLKLILLQIINNPNSTLKLRHHDDEMVSLLTIDINMMVGFGVIIGISDYDLELFSWIWTSLSSKQLMWGWWGALAPIIRPPSMCSWYCFRSQIPIFHLRSQLVGWWWWNMWRWVRSLSKKSNFIHRGSNPTHVGHW